MADLTLQQQKVAQLQAQIGRFGKRIPVTGMLDAGTAITAVALMVQRASRAVAANPGDARTVAFHAEMVKAMTSPIVYVTMNLDYVTRALKDYGDYIGKPPAGAGAPWAAYALAAVAVSVLGFGGYTAYRKFSR